MRVVESVVQEAGDGDRVIGDLGVGTQTRGHQQPVGQGPDRQSDGDPSLDQSTDVQGSRQSHQQPPRHVRGSRRQCRHPGIEVAVGEHVVVEVVRSQIGPAPDGEHGHEVDDHRDGLIGSGSHLLSSRQSEGRHTAAAVGDKDSGSRLNDSGRRARHIAARR